MSGQNRSKVDLGEGVELLHADECNAVRSALVALGEKVVVNLSRVQQDALGLTLNRVVIENRLEYAVGEVFDLARCTAQTQHCLRGEDNERSLGLRVRLTAQQVEIRSRS